MLPNSLPSLLIRTLAVFCAATPALAWGHVRWFVDSPSEAVSFPWGGLYLAIVAGGPLYCLALKYLAATEARYVAGAYRRFPHWQRSLKPWQLMSALVGLTFILNSINDVLLAPNLEFRSSDLLLNWAQLLTGIALILNISMRLGGTLILALLLMLLFSHPLAIWVDYGFEFIGIGLCLILYRDRQMALFYLRCGLGLQLMVLAVHNKWLNPQLGLEFLSHHPWNFMQMLGWTSFTDLAFVFSAGTTEFCFGLTLLLGWSSRLTTAIVSLFFLITAAVLGIHELIGHLPIIGAAIVLIVMGGGRWPGFARAPAIVARAC